MEPTTFVIETDAGKDLQFEGTQIAAADNRWIVGKEQNRWYELAIYRTTEGRYILAETYISQWQGEEGSRKAKAYDTAAEVVDALFDRSIDDRDMLGRLEKELLRAAAAKEPAFAKLITEIA